MSRESLHEALIRFVDVGPGVYRVEHENGAVLGEALPGDDGFLMYWPDRDRGGGWPAWAMREIADRLDEQNAEWSRMVEEYFANE